MLGIDIDPRLVEAAWASPLPPGRCAFRREDFVLDPHPDHNYDTVTAFSVVKWVHLLHGDEGLVNFFAKIHDLLRPGGFFVLEPQDWPSYKKARKSSDAAWISLSHLALRPAGFRDVLLSDRVGFVSCSSFGGEPTGGQPPSKEDGAEDLEAGFRGRPMLLFRKAGIDKKGGSE